jgi:hypothetical protein
MDDLIILLMAIMVLWFAVPAAINHGSGGRKKGGTYSGAIYQAIWCNCAVRPLRFILRKGPGLICRFCRFLRREIPVLFRRIRTALNI